jgi:heme/copper-type cytochrome/quinol oxidase subunit 2
MVRVMEVILSFKFRMPAIALAVLGATLFSAPAVLAQSSIGELLTAARTSQLGPIASFAGAVCFILGVVFGITALLKFRANASNPNDPSNKISTAIVTALVAAALIGIPSFLGVGVNTLFGAGAQTTSIESTLTSLGTGT